MRSLPHTSFFKRSGWLHFFFYLFILLVLANRFFLFLQLNLDHIDSDQPVMWLGARHFSEGLFYAPRYYGQDYNTFFEALLAVPFMKLGVPVYYAVPIVTHVLSLIPFLFTACYLFFLQKKIQALLVLIILLCMPTGYDIMNSLPRGFVTGMFFTTPFILSVQHPGRLKYILLNSFCAYIAYLVNPNSLLASIPFLFYLFLWNYRDKKYYLFTVAGLLMALPLHYLLNHFYTTHPGYVQHDFQNAFSWYYFIEAIQHLDQRFAHINFFADEQCAFILLVMVITGVLFFFKNKKAFYTHLVLLLFILLSFFSSKIADGVTWPFYSFSRMYLGIPIVLYLLLSSITFHSTRFIYPLILITVFFLPFKELNRKAALAYETDVKKWVFLHLASLKNTKEVTTHYKNVCRTQQTNDLVIAGDLFCKEELAYGGPAIDPGFPNTFITSGERRSWLIEANRKKILKRFILLTTDYTFDKRGFDSLYNFKITRLDDYGCFLITDQEIPLTQFLEKTGTPVNGKKELN